MLRITVDDYIEARDGLIKRTLPPLMAPSSMFSIYHKNPFLGRITRQSQQLFNNLSGNHLRWRERIGKHNSLSARYCK
jgi:hypothetical protein